MLEKLIIVVHLLTALSVIGLILLQQGKGADMGASFGSGSSQTVFGAGGGGNVLTRATAILAAIFLATSLGLSVYAKRHANAVEDPDVPVVESLVPAAKEESGDVPVAAPAPAASGDVPAAAVDSAPRDAAPQSAAPADAQPAGDVPAAPAEPAPQGQ
jgi:preprotein translocase subunit SecG